MKMTAMFSFLRTRHLKAQSRNPKRSEREVLLFKDREVHVRRKAYKRSIGLTLQVNGRIRVSAPKSTPLSNIEAFLLANTNWIETHLRKYETLRQAYPPKRFAEGEGCLYLGKTLMLHFERGFSTKLRFEVRDQNLVVLVPPNIWADGFDASMPHPELEQPLVRFYSDQGRLVISERLRLYADRMRLQPSQIVFRSQKTRWGSCSAKGRISLNWRLIIAPLDVIDYVVVHELSHLKHYNHSQSFWKLVSTQVPRYAELRQWLRDHQYDADFLAKRSELHV